MLLKMPGVNSKNYRYLMNKVKDIAELSSLSEEALSGVMGSNQHAKLLWNFLHKEQTAADTTTGSKTTKTEPGKRWSKRKR